MKEDKMRDKAAQISQGLQKGDFLPVDQLEHLFGVESTKMEYSHCLMTLRGVCENLGFFVKQEKWGLRILTDKESSLVNKNRWRKHMEAANKKAMLQKSIDLSSFTQEEKEDHHHVLSIMDRVMKPARDIVRQNIALARTLKEKKQWPRLG